MNIKSSITVPDSYKGTRPYQVCSRCVMDTSDPDIQFNEAGECNHCTNYYEKRPVHVPEPEIASRKLEQLVDEIKASGKGKPYDCVMGLSGGVDSSYVALKAKDLGLRPLAVHFDNGWNSELAVNNIEHLISILGYDLYTLVVNWEEFRDLQLAYIRASVIDIEVVTDHAIIGTIFRLTRENGLKYFLSGGNFVTEGILPKAWIYQKRDHLNLKDIHGQYGQTPLKTYPIFTYWDFVKSINIKRIRPISLLNYLPYHRGEAKKELAERVNWRDYGGKHHESIFTKFYQGYILPEKFGVDKRRAHLATMICSGHLTRDEALAILETPIYPAEELEADKEYVIKKFGMTEAEFDKIMAEPPRSHYDFKTNHKLKEFHHSFVGTFKKILGRS